MKKFEFKKTAACALCTVLMCANGVSANPGSADDPLITLSYVNDVLIPQIKSYVDTHSGLQAAISNGVYNVVNVSKGQIIVGGQSCHMIMRTGSGSAIAGVGGGIADVTGGTDLKTGTPIPLNHELIFPLDDGRGIKMETDAIVMVKGIYSVRNG